MTLQGYQFDKSKVTPESDASLYSYLAQGLDNKVINGMTATASGLNLYIEPGKALVQGRFVEVTQQHQLSAQANTSGYVVITIDLTQTNTATGTPGTVYYKPVNNQLRLEIVESLNRQDLGSGGAIYTLPLYSYTSTGTSVVLKNAFKIVNDVKWTYIPGSYNRAEYMRRGDTVTIRWDFTSEGNYDIALGVLPVAHAPQKKVFKSIQEVSASSALHVLQINGFSGGSPGAITLFKATTGAVFLGQESFVVI